MREKLAERDSHDAQVRSLPVLLVPPVSPVFFECVNDCLEWQQRHSCRILTTTLPAIRRDESSELTA